MIAFSIVELFNKFLGLYMTGYLARVLPKEAFGAYLTGLVMLGYALEIAFFGSQNRHNADNAIEPDYLGSTKFAARRTVTLLSSLVAAGFLFIALRSDTGFMTAPLLLILAFVPFSFDYLAYGSGRSQLVVAARLLSQLVAVLWIYVVSNRVVGTQYLYWGNLLQTTTMSLVIIAGLFWLGKLRTPDLFVGVARFPVAVSDLRAALNDQGTAFAIRLIALALVSGELLLLGFMGSKLSGELATSLRLVQVIFPFVVFYVDSRVVSVSSEGFNKYLVVVFALTGLMLLASPLLVVLLYGNAYRTEVAAITAFLPAFTIQAIVQYLIMLSLKTGFERGLLARLCIPVGFTALALLVPIGSDLSITDIQVIYVIKLALFLLLIPRISNRKRVIACACGLAIVALNRVLDGAGYYDFVVSVSARMGL